MDGRSLTRRRLLEYAGLGAAAIALPATGFGSAKAAEPSQSPGNYDDGTDFIPGGLKGDPSRVIIIGAGFAGLAAANALSRAGVSAVVLEARQRIGGRVDTRLVGETSLDLGASWVHQPSGNPMSALAEQAGVQLTAASPELDALTILLHDVRTGKVPDSEKLLAYLKSLEFDEESAAIGDALGRSASWRDGARRFLDDRGIVGDERRRISFVIQLYAELEGAKSWQHQPLANRPGSVRPPAANHPEYTGDGLGDFPVGGYRRIIKALAGGSDIRLGHQVTEVKASDSGVEVRVRLGQDGAARSRTFRGSHVLVTVPLGVLKQGAIRFTPGLGDRKRQAIRNLGYGNFEKVALTFDRPFWQEQGHTHLLHIGRESSSRFPMFIDLQKFVGRPTLVSLNAGAAARRLARIGPAAARREAMAVLREVYGKSIPAPEAVAVTDWTNDRFAAGAYSAVVMKTSGDERARLARPAHGRILFAGEATNLDGRASTTDGAFSSGIREAKRLLGTREVQINT